MIHGEHAIHRSRTAEVSVDVNELARVARVRDFIKDGGARTLRIEKGLHLTEVANAIGVSDVSVWCYEHGQRTPNAQHALALADLYEALGWEG